MNKFKFEPPQEHRRSLQAPKNQHLSLVTTLDKCTQILREDRLFLRNEIKNSNHEVLEIFKQFPRASQLQNLQIKLRKYVQNVKSRIKTEQLNKFKETLSMNSTIAEPKRQNNQLKSTLNTLKQPFKPNCSVELNRTNHQRSNKSVEHSSTISTHLNMNNSLRHFQQLLKNKFTQQVIEQRQSENVTSARQNRQQTQYRPKPLQQQLFDPIQNKLVGKSASYNFIPNKTLDSNLNFLQDFNKEKPRFNNQEPNTKPPAWQFQKKNPIKAYYQFQTNAQNKPQQSNFASKSRPKQNAYEQKQYSIFDQHFYGSQKESKFDPKEYFSQNSNTFDIKNPISFTLKDQSNNLVFSKVQQGQKGCALMETNFPLKQQSFTREVTFPVKTSVSRIQGSRSSQQSLFTPMDLLNECRNFLKHRENSTQKSNIQLNLDSFAQPQKSLSQNPIEINAKKEQSSLIFPQEKIEFNKKQQDSMYLFPQIKESNKKQQGNVNDSYHFTHFETFANSLEKPNPFKPHSESAKQKLPTDFSIQMLLQSMMEITDMNPFITVKELINFVNNHMNKEALKLIFSKQLQMSKNDEICLTTLSSLINERYNQQSITKYPHSDKTINSVYDLLDIDQKGYINKEDVDTFLTQIEQAEVQNYEQVSEELWRLFDGADFNNQHKLTYWHFFLVKNSEEFERVSQLLGEFEFQIERNE